jgi:hypothetical protein
MLKPVAILFSILALVACSKKTAAPVGVNFSPDSDASIVLNERAGAWQLFIDGVDVSQAVGLGVQGDPAVGQALLTVTQKGTPVEKLPSTFTLEWTGKTTCLNCSGKLRAWSRSEVK